jgi:CRP-like cAMP-binding protein
MPRAFFPTLFCGEAARALELRELQGLATQVDFHSGKTIFSESEPADAVYGLSQGVVRLYKLLPDGRRQILAFALPGDFLGMPLADRHNFSADAIGAVALCRFSRDDLTKFIQSSPSIMRLVMEFVIRELDMAQDQLLAARQWIGRGKSCGISRYLAQPVGAPLCIFGNCAAADAASGYC